MSGKKKYSNELKLQIVLHIRILHIFCSVRKTVKQKIIEGFVFILYFILAPGNDFPVIAVNAVDPFIAVFDDKEILG